MTKSRSLQRLRVLRRPNERSRAILSGFGQPIWCAIGRGGIRTGKREGDGATPRAVLRPVRVYVRGDRRGRLVTRLPLSLIRTDLGWCDDVGHRAYNRPIALPTQASHERMMRDDGLYDVVVELDWNRRPAIRGRGSAIFLHVARPGLLPTEGCLALPLPVLRRLVSRLTPDTRIVIG